MPETEHINRQIKELIVEALNLQVSPEEIPDDESLFGGSMGMDSTATLEIIFAVEEAFGIEVDDEELRVEMFDSVRTLTTYVEQKLAATDPAPDFKHV